MSEEKEVLQRMTPGRRWAFLRTLRSEPGLLERLRERMKGTSGPPKCGGSSLENTKETVIFEPAWLSINAKWRRLNVDTTRSFGVRGPTHYSG